MENKNYLEFRRLTLVEPPCLYYLLVYIIIILSWILCVTVGKYLYHQVFPQEPSDLTAIESYFIFLTIATIFFIRRTRERALIHDNGNLEVYGLNHHTTTPITEIKQVHFNKRRTICGNAIVIKLELKNGKVIKLLLKENEQFLAELKKHNSNIIIPELPVV